MSMGWQPDPTGRFEVRYHDGVQWTEHVATQGVASRDPFTAPPPPPPAPVPVAPGPGAPPAAPAFGAPPQGEPVVTPFGAPRPSTPFGAPGDAPIEPNPLIQEANPARKGWLLLAMFGLLVIAAAVAYLLARDGTSGDDETVDRAPVPTSIPLPLETAVPGTEQQVTPTTAITDPATGTTAPTPPPTAPPGATAPPATSGVAPVGTELPADGGIVRINRVTPNAVVDPFFAPDAPATVTEIEIEMCAGTQPLFVNGLSFTAFLADNTVAPNFYFGDQLPSLRMAPGGCARGIVTFEVAGGGTVSSVVYTDSQFAEGARWTVDGAVEPTARLAPPAPPVTIPVGQPATFGAGHTATVRSVTDAATPLDEFFQVEAGKELTQIDVEVCAGTEPLPSNGLYWLVVTADGWMGTSRLVTDTLPVLDVAAGQCVAGIVEAEVPVGSTTVQVVHVDAGFSEVARWQR